LSSFRSSENQSEGDGAVVSLKFSANKVTQ
jgi:hypothetical protein